MRRGVRFIERWDRVTGYILLFIGLVTAWSSVHLSMGRFRHPGPGFLPFGLSIVLAILSMVLIFTRWEKGATPTPFWPRRTWLRPFLGLAFLILYAFLIGKLGFLLTSLTFLLTWLGVIERVRWLTMVSISISVTVALYLIFGLFLEVPLPRGFLKW
jgi:putative tricarboxylic transport membrane protein